MFICYIYEILWSVCLYQTSDMAVKNNCKAAAFMLKNALKHNQNVLKALREIGKVEEDSFSDMRQYMDEESMRKGIMYYYCFYEDSDTVSFSFRIPFAGEFPRDIFKYCTC